MLGGDGLGGGGPGPAASRAVCRRAAADSASVSVRSRLVTLRRDVSARQRKISNLSTLVRGDGAGDAATVLAPSPD